MHGYIIHERLNIMNNQVDDALLEHMMSFCSENKQDLINTIVPIRTKYLTVVLEDIFQPQNASAVVRSCECFGVQDIHVIENENEFSPNPKIVIGSSKWVDIHKYSEEENNTIATLKELKSKGYRIIATTPHEKDATIDEIDIEAGPMALVFGSEQPGISDLAREHADEFVKIPMHGFTESFNISVSAAICLYELTKRIRSNENIDWKLTDQEQRLLKYDWAKKVVKYSEQIEERYINERK
jgi:tRNA (guanosine-2'-O-)-methyltransferase